MLEAQEMDREEGDEDEEVIEEDNEASQVETAQQRRNRVTQ